MEGVGKGLSQSGACARAREREGGRENDRLTHLPLGDPLLQVDFGQPDVLRHDDRRVQRPLEGAGEDVLDVRVLPEEGAELVGGLDSLARQAHVEGALPLDEGLRGEAIPRDVDGLGVARGGGSARGGRPPVGDVPVDDGHALSLNGDVVSQLFAPLENSATFQSTNRTSSPKCDFNSST